MVHWVTSLGCHIMVKDGEKLDKTKIATSNGGVQCSGRFLGLTSWDPRVYESNQLHSDVLKLFFEVYSINASKMSSNSPAVLNFHMQGTGATPWLNQGSCPFITLQCTNLGKGGRRKGNYPRPGFVQLKSLVRGGYNLSADQDGVEKTKSLSGLFRVSSLRSYSIISIHLLPARIIRLR